MVLRVVGPDPEGAAVYQAKLIVRQIYVLQSLANEGITIDFVDVTMAQVQRDDVVVGVAQRSQDFNERIVAEVERWPNRLVLVAGRRRRKRRSQDRKRGLLRETPGGELLLLLRRKWRQRLLVLLLLL